MADQRSRDLYTRQRNFSQIKDGAEEMQEMQDIQSHPSQEKRVNFDSRQLDSRSALVPSITNGEYDENGNREERESRGERQPSPRQFVHSSRRHRTDMKDKWIVESRVSRHAAIIRRPRALHYEPLDAAQKRRAGEGGGAGGEGREKDRRRSSAGGSAASVREQRRSSGVPATGSGGGGKGVSLVTTRSRRSSTRDEEPRRTKTTVPEALEEDDGDGDDGGPDERSTDDVPKMRSRLDLFVDLIWAGIIANLSSTFGDNAFRNDGVSIGLGLVIFVLSFILIWRVWDNLRAYTSAFFIDDILQRNFTLWILVLAVLYGINAPYAYDPDKPNSLSILIVIYIITKVSFLAAWGLQALFIPFLRRQFYFQLLLVIVSSAVWIAAMLVPTNISKLVLIVVANAVENPATVFLASPAADRLLTKEMRRKPDVDHYIERYEGFFIVILGEGVIRLIDGSSSGLGLNSATGTILTALLMYYMIHWIYFNGDQSREYVHALRRTWWKPVLWQAYHVALFGSLLCLDASVLYLIQNSDDSTTSSATETPDQAKNAAYALWTASISLAMVMVNITSIALLNRALDAPSTLVINSRWVRLAPRLPVTALIICLPLIPGMNAQTWCAAVIALLYGVFSWEWFGGLEKNWTFVEPREEDGGRG